MRMNTINNGRMPILMVAFNLFWRAESSVLDNSFITSSAINTRITISPNEVVRVKSVEVVRVEIIFATFGPYYRKPSLLIVPQSNTQVNYPRSNVEPSPFGKCKVCVGSPSPPGPGRARPPLGSAAGHVRAHSVFVGVFFSPLKKALRPSAGRSVAAALAVNHISPPS
jgi:hypothetical protein